MTSERQETRTYYTLTYPTGARCTMPPDMLAGVVEAELQERDPGYAVERVEMTPDEYDSLPEFAGP